MDECYICYEEYITNSGLSCVQCKSSCCDKCYMKQWIKYRRYPKCGLCRFDDNNRVVLLATIERRDLSRVREC